MNQFNLNEFLSQSISFYIKTKDAWKMEEKQINTIEWKRLGDRIPLAFEDSKFFLDSIELLKDDSAEKKYYFLKTYEKLFKVNVIDKLINGEWGFKNLCILGLYDIYDILGPRLIVSNGTKISYPISFSDRTSNVKALTGNEIAPIIESWVKMWLEIKHELQDSFDEKLFTPIINEKGQRDSLLRLDLQPAYLKFVQGREMLIDNYIARGLIDDGGFAL